MKSSDELKQDIVFEARLRGHDLTFHSTWGLFSPRGIDDGSRLLIRHVEGEGGRSQRRAIQAHRQASPGHCTQRAGRVSSCAYAGPLG